MHTYNVFQPQTITTIEMCVRHKLRVICLLKFICHLPHSTFYSIYILRIANSNITTVFIFFHSLRRNILLNDILWRRGPYAHIESFIPITLLCDWEREKKWLSLFCRMSLEENLQTISANVSGYLCKMSQRLNFLETNFVGDCYARFSLCSLC